jgi:hypothetical protein
VWKKVSLFFAFLGALAIAMAAIFRPSRGVSGEWDGVKQVGKGLDDGSKRAKELVRRELATKVRLDEQERIITRASESVDDGSKRAKELVRAELATKVRLDEQERIITRASESVDDCLTTLSDIAKRGKNS